MCCSIFLNVDIYLKDNVYIYRHINSLNIVFLKTMIAFPTEMQCISGKP